MDRYYTHSLISVFFYDTFFHDNTEMILEIYFNKKVEFFFITHVSLRFFVVIFAVLSEMGI